MLRDFDLEIVQAISDPYREAVDTSLTVGYRLEGGLVEYGKCLLRVKSLRQHDLALCTTKAV